MIGVIRFTNNVCKQGQEKKKSQETNKTKQTERERERHYIV